LPHQNGNESSIAQRAIKERCLHQKQSNAEAKIDTSQIVDEILKESLNEVDRRNGALPEVIAHI